MKFEDTDNSVLKPENTREFRSICKQSARTSQKYRMLAAGDRVVVGISGGEDSLLLMHVLHHLQRRAPFHFDLFPVFVDMGFQGVNRTSLMEYCENQGWKLHVVKIDGSGLLSEKLLEEKPCPLCSRLRRGQLHAVADQLNCNKLALGHHLDDLCVSFLISLFRGGGLKTMGPNVLADTQSENAVTKRLIRPFAEIEKSQISAAASQFGFPEMHSCPYEATLEARGDRAYLEQMLKSLEGQFKFLRSNMLHSMGDIRLAHLLDMRYLTSDADPDSGKL